MKTEQRIAFVNRENMFTNQQIDTSFPSFS